MQRDIKSITDKEAIELIKIELAHDKAPKPTRVKVESRTTDGIRFIVYAKQWAPHSTGFTFNGRKCYAGYKYLESLNIKL